jgi:CheY-like chemotaxis protein
MPNAYVIEDHRESADCLVRLLEVLGYQARMALGPLPALAALARSVPDVIFLDLHMNGMDGIEVCRYLRRDPRTARLIIIAISSDTQPELIERVRRAGADGFLAKPLSLDDLEPVLARVAERLAVRRLVPQPA